MKTKNIADYYKRFLCEKYEQCPQNYHSPHLLQSVVFFNQIDLFLSAIQKQLSESKNVLESLNIKMKTVVQTLHTLCRLRSAVPVDQVYPQFMTLASLWECFQDELFVDAMRHGIADSISDYCRVAINTIPESELSPTHQKDALSNIKNVEKFDAEKIIRDAVEMQDFITKKMLSNAEVLHPGNCANFPNLPLEFQGFCPGTLARRQGLCSLGCKSLGILKYKDKLYCFATLSDAKAFISAPQEYVNTN